MSDHTLDLITIAEAADLCRVSQKWWRRRIAGGTCPVTVYRIGKHIRLDRLQIERELLGVPLSVARERLAAR